MLKPLLLGLVLTGTFVVSACSTSSQTEQAATPQPAVSDTAQNSDSLPGMNHGSEMTMDMDLGPKDENFDLRFIDAMLLHHQGAIDMAEEALEKSDRTEIKQLAQAIVDAQQQEIQQMQNWRQAWYPDAGEQPVMYHAEMGHMMPMSAEMQSSMTMSEDLGAADAEFDLRFINAMVPHHEGAVKMAAEALEKSDRPEIQELAQQIIDSQQPEIDQMQQWKQEWYGQ